MGREDHQARVIEADQHGEYVGALRRACLLVVGERGLVAMVAVGDQKLAVCEGLVNAVGGEAPEACALDLEVRLALGTGRWRRAFVEEEERLELRPNLAQEPQPLLLRPAVGALVRKDDAVLVGLGAQRPTRPSRVRATPSGPT